MEEESSLSVNHSSLNEDESEDENDDVTSLLHSSRSHSSATPRTIKLNLYVLSFAMMIVFTAFASLQALQSSLNATAGRGVTCLAVLYGVMVFSSVFLAPVLVGKLRPKRTLIVGFFGHCVFTASNFYPQWWSLIPGCAFLGAVGAPLWAAHNTYLTSIAAAYAVAEGMKKDEVIQQFSGIFYAVYQTSGIIGNLVSSLIFMFGTDRHTNSSHTNESNVSVVNVPESARYSLLGVFEGFGVAGILLILFVLTSLKGLGVRQRSCMSVSQLAVSVVKLHRDVRLLLIIPISMYAGIHQAFFFGEYTKYYVTDVLGIHMVGFVMMTSGVIDSLSSYASGKISKLIGQAPVILAGGCLNLSLIVFLKVSTETPSESIIFIVAGLWGIVDAISNTQTTALYGMLYTDRQEAGFGAYRFWRSVGYAVSYSYSSALYHSLQTKLTLLLSFLCVSLAGYLIMEIGRRKFEAPRRSTIQS